MEDENQKPQKPPLSPARIAGELIAGAIGAIIGVGPLVELAREDSEWGFGYILMFLLTYPLGGLISSAGVYLAGTIGNQTGSFWATLGCTVLGTAGAFIIAFAADIGHWGVGDGVLFAILFITPTLGAVIGLNLTRKYKSQSIQPLTPKSLPDEQQKPPLNAARVAVQFLAGAAAAFIPLGLALPSISVSELLAMLAEFNLFFIMITALYLLFVAPMLGAIFAYIVGKRGNQKGSFGAALTGSVLAALIGIPIGFISLHLSSLILLAPPLVVSLGAVIGFNLSGRYKTPPVP